MRALIAAAALAFPTIPAHADTMTCSAAWKANSRRDCCRNLSGLVKEMPCEGLHRSSGGQRRTCRRHRPM